MKHVMLSQSERKSIAVEGAALMIYRDFTLWEISDYISVPMSTVYKVMMNELPAINEDLYDQVRCRIEEHKRRGGRHCGILPV